MTVYKARFVLEEITEIPAGEQKGYSTHRTDAIASFEVTDDTVGAAMSQITEHVRALNDWHAA